MPGPDGRTVTTDELQNRVFLAAQEANHFIDDTVEPVKDTVDQVIGAALVASRDYDMIMKAEASKSLFGEILGGVLLTLLPSLAILKTVAGPGGFKAGSTALKAVNLVEDKLDDLTKNFLDPISARIDKKEEISKEQQILAAGNVTLKRELGDLYELSGKITGAANQSRKYIRMRSAELLARKHTDFNFVAEIQKNFKEAGIGDNPRIGKAEFLALADQILYDMLKNYVTTYVSFWIVDRPRNKMNAVESAQAYLDFPALRTKRLSDLPKSRDDFFIKGIDSGKRKAIYNKFKTGIPGDTKRPAVKDYKDLIRYWEAGAHGTGGAKIIFR